MYPVSGMLMVMDTPTAPLISSFVIRFVMDSGSSHFRGEIRHIQTREEIHFSAWEEVTEFIQRYVPLETDKTDLA
jgi:hypothetical protein